MNLKESLEFLTAICRDEFEKQVNRYYRPAENVWTKDELVQFEMTTEAYANVVKFRNNLDRFDPLVETFIRQQHGLAQMSALFIKQANKPARKNC